MMKKMEHTPLLLVLLASLTLWLQGCAKNPVTGRSDVVFMSESQEIALGRQNHQKIIKHYGIYKNPELQAYVQRIGDAVAAKSHRSNLYYRFTVLDSKEVNAFALPGGYIYITRGLMAYLKTEAELAAVLGHEIGHVTARHSVRQHSTATFTNILGSIIAAKSGSRSAADLTNILGTAIVRGYGREHELEADRLGAEYLARSGYSPNAMMNVIRVLKNQELFEKKLAKKEGREPRTYHGLFSTHPDNDKRLKTVINKANNLRKPGKLKGEDRKFFLSKLDGVVFGDSEKDGVARGNRFYHNQLNFSVYFPKGWRIKNKPTSILAKSPSNDGLIQMFVTDLNKKISPRKFIETRLKVGELSSGQDLNVNALKGYSAHTDLNSSFGRRKGRVAVIFYNKKAYIIAGVAKNDSTLGRYDPLFMKTISSFHKLTREEKSLAKPLRIKLIRASQDTSFSSLARTSRISNFAADQLRLLNSMYPKGEIKPGMLIKIVR